MRIYLTAAIALALLAGCSSEQDAPAGKAAGVAASGAQALPGGAFTSPGVRAATSSFASLPDRGELLAYDAVRKPRQSGAQNLNCLFMTLAARRRPFVLQAIQRIVNAIELTNGAICERDQHGRRPTHRNQQHHKTPRILRRTTGAGHKTATAGECSAAQVQR